MSFLCKISEFQIKSFAQAINCCCKLGDDIYLDATHDQLTIKVLNEPYKSAFMMIAFESDFFETYEIEGRIEPNAGGHGASQRNTSCTDGPKVTCKLKTRSCLLAFKKEKTLSKNLDYCEIRIQSSDDFAHFTFFYKTRVIKRMDLPLGSDSLDVNDDIFQNGQSKVTCKSKILSDILTYFAKEDEYITMKATPQSIDFETHFVDRDKSGKMTKTNIDVEEFDAYTISEDIFLTFSLRLIRPFLSFCSNRIPEIDIHMEGSNQPICFNAEFPPNVKIALALATLDVNHPTTRNSSKSSVMYQTNRSSHGDPTRASNGGRRSRLPSQVHDSAPNSQNSRVGSQPIGSQDRLSQESRRTNANSVINDEHRSSLASSRGGRRPSHNAPTHSTPADQIYEENEVDMENNFPTQSSIAQGSSLPTTVSHTQSQRSYQEDLQPTPESNYSERLNRSIVNRPLSSIANVEMSSHSISSHASDMGSDSELSGEEDKILVPCSDSDESSD